MKSQLYQFHIQCRFLAHTHTQGYAFDMSVNMYKSVHVRWSQCNTLIARTKCLLCDSTLFGMNLSLLMATFHTTRNQVQQEHTCVLQNSSIPLYPTVHFCALQNCAFNAISCRCFNFMIQIQMVIVNTLNLFFLVHWYSQ